MRPPSQSTHRPTRLAGQLLPISVTLPAPATLHETPFVDVAEGIYRDMLVTESCAEYRLRLRGIYRNKDMTGYDLNIAIFDMIRYDTSLIIIMLVLYLCGELKRVCWTL